MRTTVIGLACAAWIAGVAGAAAQSGRPDPAGPSDAERRELLASAQATAKATRELVDYTRVMPDILTQILAKLDKLEDKLGKLEDAMKAERAPPRRR